MKYPVVRNSVGDAFVAAELPSSEVPDPRAGIIISRVWNRDAGVNWMS